MRLAHRDGDALVVLAPPADAVEDLVSLARHAASDSANVWIVTTVAYDVAALALLR